MNCFGLGHDSSTSRTRPQSPLSPPRSPGWPVSPKHRPKYSRKSSLSNFLGSILLHSTPSFRSRPPSPRCSSPDRHSWSTSYPPRISPPFDIGQLSSSSNLFPEIQATLENLSVSATSLNQNSPTTLHDEMERPTSSNMLLHPASATAGRMKQVKDAQDMARKVQDLAKKSGITAPPYEFVELIGKGTFGRVYKGRRQSEHDLVAVKIIDVDRADYKLAASEKDSAIQDFLKEIQILHALKDSKAKNVNKIHEAFNFHSQLWIVSEYCPGGSVHTLMKASGNPGLEERYIVAISRELAVALKYVHDAGIIHRDVKAANVLITQDGQLQLCDFGVSGILESNVAKRSTIIGTPFWMAPELLEESAAHHGYGTEVDCWAYGCTLYELSTGLPPNANIAPHRLPMFLKQAPRLEGDKYSAALKEFVSFCLEERPEDRPSADKILKHTFVANTSKRYPTVILRQLIEQFAAWESAGGQRASLFQPYGASAPTSADPFSAFDESDEWNFSTTDDFAQEMLDRYGPRTPELSQNSLSDDETPRQRKPAKTLNAVEKLQQEQRANRGAKKMARLFDANAEPYEYSLRSDEDGDSDDEEFSDLPLRRGSAARSAGDRETIIDLDAAVVAQDDSNEPNLADVDTIKAKHRYRFLESLDDEEEDQQFHNNRETKRFTRDWKFPSLTSTEADSSAQTSRPRTLEWTMAQAMVQVDPPVEVRPTLKHTVTEPVGSVGDFVHPNEGDELVQDSFRSSIIDLDAADSNILQRQDSYTSISGYSSNSTEFDENPFYHDDDPDLRTGFKLQDPIYFEQASRTREDVPSTERDDENFMQNQDTLRAKRPGRTSLHMYTQSEPNAADRTSEEPTQHNRASSLSSDTQFERIQRESKGRPANDHENQASGSNSPSRQLDYSPDHAGNVKDWWKSKVSRRFQEPLAQTSNQALLDGSQLKVVKDFPEWQHFSNDDSTDWDDDDETSLIEKSARNTGEIQKSLRSLMNQGHPRQELGSEKEQLPNGAGGRSASPKQGNLASRRGIGTAANAAAALTLSDSYTRFQSQSQPRTNYPRSLRQQRARRGRLNLHGADAREIMSHFPTPLPVNPAALEENADSALLEAELSRLLGGFLDGLGVARELIHQSEANDKARGKSHFTNRDDLDPTTVEED